MATYSAVARFSALDRFSGVLSRMEANSRKFAATSEAAMRRVNGATANLQGRFSGIGSELKSLAGILTVGTLLTAGATAVVEYDKALASMQALTGATAEQMVDFKRVVAEMAKETKQSSTDILLGFEMVGGAQPELLSSAEALGEVTKQALILSKAGKMEMADSVTALTGAMNQFGASSSEAAMYTDILATAQQKGSGTVNYLAQAIVKSGGTMKAFGNTFEDTAAILEGFAKAGVPAAEAGTMLSGILSKLSKVSQKEFNPQYTKATDIINNLAKANLSYSDLMKLTDGEGAKWITQIIGQNAVVQELTGNLNDVGSAQDQAATSTATLSEGFNQLTNSYKNAIIANTAESAGVNMLSGLLAFLANNMDIIIGLIAGTVSVLLPMIAMYKLAALATTAYNTVLGLSVLLQGKGAIALKGNVVALKAYKVATAIATAAQTAFNVAMTANPIGLIIAAIVAVIAVIALLVKHWDLIKAKFMAAPTWLKMALAPFIIATAPILILVNTIRKLIDAWGGIKRAFAEGGILDGIKKIGGVLLSALLDPLVFILKAMAKIPGMAKFIDPITSNIRAFQGTAEAGFGVDQKLGNANTQQPINTQATQMTTQSEVVKTQQQNVTIDINDPTNRLKVKSGNGAIPVRVNGTSNAL